MQGIGFKVITTQCQNTEASDRYDLRLPLSLHGPLAALARESDRSVNAEIKQAIAQWFDPHSTIKVMHALLLSSHEEVTVIRLLSGVDVVSFERVPVRPFRKGLTSRQVAGKNLACRLRPGQLRQIDDAAAPLNISMNTFILRVIAWWVNIKREIEVLKSAAG